MGLPELTSKLKTKNITGVYFFYGDEEYTKDFYIRKLRSYCDSAPSPEYADVILDGTSLTPDLLGDTIDTPAFMSEWKVIEINGFPLNQTPSDSTSYADILSSVPYGVAVVFIYRAGNFDKTVFTKTKEGANELVDFFARSCISVEFELQTGDKLVQWIAKHFKAESVEITDRALTFLPEYCGSDMYILSGEIEKLCSYSSGNAITEDDIRNVCCSNSEYRLYDITNCISSGSINRLKSVYDGLVSAKVSPEMILGTVSGYFCDMLNVKTAIAEGVSPSEAKKRLGMQDWQYNRIASAVRNVPMPFICRAIEECRAADVTVKTHSSDPYVMIEIMLYRIMSYGKKNA